MQATTGTLAEAILARDRPQLLFRVRVDFPGTGTWTDLSAMVESVSVNRALATDLPEPARFFTGSGAADATVVFAGLVPGASDETKHAAWYWSAYATGSDQRGASPIASGKRRARPITIDIGFRTPAGAEYVRVFTGKTRDVVVDPGTRAVTVSCLDRAVTLRRRVTLPMIVADDQTHAGGAKNPGLSGGFLADYVLRRAGYYASPPARSAARLVATMHGSAWPEVGSMQDIHAQTFGNFAFTDWPAWTSIPAQWNAAIFTAGNSDEQLDYVLSGTLSTNNGGTAFYEGWVRPDNIAGASGGSPFALAYRTGASTPWISVWIDTTGRLQCSWNRGGTDNTNRSTGASGPNGFVDDTWYYVACYLEFNNGSVDVWLTQTDGTWASKITVTAGSTTTTSAINTAAHARGYGGGFAAAYYNGYAESVQWTAENGSGTPPAVNSGFVPSASVDRSKNLLDATPVTEREQAWAVLQQLATAELAMFGFDEHGVPRFTTRDRFTSGAGLVVQRTLSSAPVGTTDPGAITSLRVTESLDQVRNKVVVTLSPADVQAPSDVWRLTGLASIPASDSRSFWLRFEQPVANLDTQVISHGSAGQSRYNASTRKDGAGSAVTNLSFSFASTGAGGTQVTIANPNAFVVYLVGNSGVAGVTQGVPSFILNGQFIRFDQQAVNTRTQQEASDATSITDYDEELLLELPPNPFLQDLDTVGTLTTDLVTQLADPPPVLTGEVVGDPRLQLADRVTVVEQAGLGLSGQDAHIAGAKLTATGGEQGGLTLALELRGA